MNFKSDVRKLKTLIVLECLVFCLSRRRSHDNLEAILCQDSSHLKVPSDLSVSLAHKVMRLVFGVVAVAMNFVFHTEHVFVSDFVRPEETSGGVVSHNLQF